VSGLQLVARVLGEVPAAETFSAAATRYIAESGERIDDSAEAVHELSGSLVASADTYQRMDEGTASVFRHGK
jgi:hypothetical protein